MAAFVEESLLERPPAVGRFVRLRAGVGRLSPMARKLKALADKEEMSPKVAWLTLAERLMHFVVAFVLIYIAGALLLRSLSDLPPINSRFWVAVPSAINDILLVVIVLEIVRTVLAHFTKTGITARPFLTIGIIAAIRHLLTVGVELSAKDVTRATFDRGIVELGVNAAVALALVIGLVLFDRGGSHAGRDADAPGQRAGV